jgi:NAD(P)-dependent dehydrogenase (short-subunit alcohol dehydrogenase family)
VKEFRDRVAVVTGGASGIGLGMCQRFAREGMQVVCADIELAAAEQVCHALRASGARALAARVDVSQRDSVEALAETAYSELGGVHLLCNNAGVIVGGTLAQATEDDWRWVLGVNLYGVIHGCHAFVPRMLEAGAGGHIVNTASMGGIVSAPTLGVYCTSKFAVVGFSEALALELAPHAIGVSVLCPGGVRTNLLAATRNRPSDLPETGGDASILARAVADGLEPGEVGEIVLRGVRAGALHIFTHADYRQHVQRRSDALLAAFDLVPSA